MLQQMVLGSGARGSKPNEVYFQTSYVPAITTAYINPEGEFERSDVVYTKNNIKLYLSYGLFHESLSLNVSTGFLAHSLHGGDSTDERSGITDTVIGLDYRFYQFGALSFALGYDMGIPTGAFEEGSELSLGDDEYDYAPKLYTSYYGWDFVLWYRFRTEGYTEDLNVKLQYGHSPLKKLWLTYGLSAQFQLTSLNQSKLTRYLDFGEGVSYFTPFLSVLYSISPNFHITFNFAPGSLPALNRNQAGITYFSPGVAITF